MKIKVSPQKKIITFLLIVLALSAFFYYFILSAKTMQVYGGLMVLGLMWAPGLAGMTTQLIYEHTLRGMGWGFGKPKYLLLAYLLPLIYCLVVYGFTWLSGLGEFPGPQFAAQFSPDGTAAPGAILGYVALMASLGFLQSMLSATGEEIGWRGLLIPEMAKIMSFPKVALISGVIWSLYHYPVLFFADYNMPGIPKWYAGLMFTILVLGISFVFAWLRLKSGSLWTAAILHASHNIFIQGVFTPLTGTKAMTPYIIDEFGAGLALLAIALGLIFWRKSKDLPIVSSAT